ncbi:MAG: hypothetical protein ACD_45C00501G0002 [uncultured bacterium]|nr:MAG: hypothetical protein ACD_45C00501G0002 [uncultured bacterium]OGT55306.1 MAG: twitching motility protein PilT [Gammaproteobacteria bacterium RIFCSPHIGHO2_12_FULL_42_10]
MKVLLDTQAFLWLSVDSAFLSKKSKKVFLEEKNDLYLSLASVWEMSIKTSIGKLKVPGSVEAFVLTQLHENSILQLPIHFRHVARVEDLPFCHRDPFDRLLISQALEEKMAILSNDAVFDKYAVDRIW